MELTELRVFLKVATERSFSRAAMKMHRTQPAVSQSVRRLEESVGERLFDRATKDATLTDAVDLAKLARARRLVTFHHDPAHNDATLDDMLSVAQAHAGDALEVMPGREGETFQI